MRISLIGFISAASFREWRAQCAATTSTGTSASWRSSCAVLRLEPVLGNRVERLVRDRERKRDHLFTSPLAADPEDAERDPKGADDRQPVVPLRLPIRAAVFREYGRLRDQIRRRKGLIPR